MMNEILFGIKKMRNYWILLLTLCGCQQPTEPLDYQIIGRALCKVQYDLVDAYYLTQTPERAELHAAIEHIWNDAEQTKVPGDDCL